MNDQKPAPWHNLDNVVLSESTLTELLDSKGSESGKNIVIAPNDSRVKRQIPIQNSHLTDENNLKFPEDTVFHINDLPDTDNKEYEYEGNRFDVAFLFLEPRTQQDRFHPFYDATRIVKNGGKIIAVTGINNRGDYSKASYWFGTSNCATPIKAHIVGYINSKTPQIVIEYKITDPE